MLKDLAPTAFIPTTDFDRARAFYEGVLGLAVEGFDGFALILKAGGQTIRVVKPPAFTPFAFTLLGFNTTDIDSEVTALAAKGVVFERFFPVQRPNGVWEAPGGGCVAWFKDPDGNLLSIAQAA